MASTSRYADEFVWMDGAVFRYLLDHSELSMRRFAETVYGSRSRVQRVERLKADGKTMLGTKGMTPWQEAVRIAEAGRFGAIAAELITNTELIWFLNAGPGQGAVVHAGHVTAFAHEESARIAAELAFECNIVRGVSSARAKPSIYVQPLKWFRDTMEYGGNVRVWTEPIELNAFQYFADCERYLDGENRLLDYLTFRTEYTLGTMAGMLENTASGVRRSRLADLVRKSVELTLDEDAMTAMWHRVYEGEMDGVRLEPWNGTQERTDDLRSRAGLQDDEPSEETEKFDEVVGARRLLDAGGGGAGDE